jgi:hypothetical protein
VPNLQFPTDRIVGTLDWNGSWTDERGPVLATGSVSVPDDVAVSLRVQAVRGTASTGGGSWSVDVAQDPVDLGFLRDLPATDVESVTLHRSVEATFDAVAHLAPGVRKLYLVGAGFSDAVLETVAELTGLTYLQTFRNDFTDHGVQRLASLVNLEHLYLEEATLTAAAFGFVDQLPHLARLGLQDVPITSDELDRLRARLPGVDVG